MDLAIQAPRQGIAQSPHVGFADVRGLDIFTIPGICRLNNSLKTTCNAGVITGLVKWIVRDPATPANIYALDADGKVYQSTDSGVTFAVLAGNTTTNAHGNGLAIYKNYLFVARDTAMDLYGPLSSSPAWRNGWAGLTMDSDTLFHPMLVSKLDDSLYGGAGRYVFSVTENVGQTFTWDNVATYTATAQHLALPTGYRIKCLEELGNNLMIGTWKGTTITDFKVADVFNWDGTSTTYGQPMMLNENGINAMLVLGNNLYLLAGVDGKIYRSDGINAVIVGQIPSSIANIEGSKYLEPFPGAFVNYKGRPTFGVSSGGSTYTGGMGVYSLQETSKGNILTNEHNLAYFGTSGNDGTTAVIKIGALLSIARDKLLVGGQDGTNYEIDITDTSNRVTGYAGYFDTPLYRVGNRNNKYKIKEIEITFTNELAANEGIRISYRVNLTDSFTTLKTYDYTVIGADISRVVNILPDDEIRPSEFVQFRIALTGTTTTPHLSSVIFR
jgi:hypothetical protein